MEGILQLATDLAGITEDDGVEDFSFAELSMHYGDMSTYSVSGKLS